MVIPYLAFNVTFVNTHITEVTGCVGYPALIRYDNVMTVHGITLVVLVPQDVY